MLVRLLRSLTRNPTARYDAEIREARNRQLAAIRRGDPQAFEIYRRDVETAVRRYIKASGERLTDHT
jgi:hypothetical protein